MQALTSRPPVPIYPFERDQAAGNKCCHVYLGSYNLAKGQKAVGQLKEEGFASVEPIKIDVEVVPPSPPPAWPQARKR